MTVALILMALYALASYVAIRAEMKRRERAEWEKHPDLGAVDLHDYLRNRKAQAADDARLMDEASGFGQRRSPLDAVQRDLIARRMRLHQVRR